LGLVRNRYSWVDEFYRGKGIGKHLVDYAEHKAKDTGAKRAKLTFDFQAKKFYEKLGYVSMDDLRTILKVIPCTTKKGFIAT